MIIIDDFIKDEKILKHFSYKETWDALDIEEEFTTWNGLDFIEDSILGDFIWEVKNKFWGDKTWSIFEYWINRTDSRFIVDWHVDKNEALAEEGDIVSPQIGAVWYGYPHEIVGGYLEISTDPGQLQRIKPVYNRIVVFDVTEYHRVSPVLNGTRYGLQLNLW